MTMREPNRRTRGTHEPSRYTPSLSALYPTLQGGIEDEEIVYSDKRLLQQIQNAVISSYKLHVYSAHNVRV